MLNVGLSRGFLEVEWLRIDTPPFYIYINLFFSEEV